MEGDTIRTSGTATLIDLWVEGQMRELVVTREAIAAAVGAERAAAMSEAERCEFVRTRLSLIQDAARTAAREGGEGLTRITLAAACLVDPSLGSGGERRRSARRATDRRKAAASAKDLPFGERRRTDRRRGGDRRGTLSPDAPA